jgi:hypothetical protein
MKTIVHDSPLYSGTSFWQTALIFGIILELSLELRYFALAVSTLFEVCPAHPLSQCLNLQNGDRLRPICFCCQPC